MVYFGPLIRDKYKQIAKNKELVQAFVIFLLDVIGFYLVTNPIHFAGILFIGLVIVLIYFPRHMLDVIVRNTSSIRDDSYLEDFEKEDRLARIEFVNKLCACISGHRNRKSVVMGLYGGWGEGKTSVINAVHKKISANRKFIVFEFNPWHYATIDSISKAFFNDLKTKLESELGIGRGWNILGDYCQSLEFGAMGFKLGLWPHFKATKEILQDINTKIWQSDKKLLIIIDDIDRLSSEQIIHVFELVRNSASFKNTIYLLAFDPIQVRNILPSPDFIEKIVQIGIELPAIEQHIIKRDILKFVDTFPKDCLPDNSYLLEEMFDIAISKNIKTLRQTKSYLNNLSFALPMVYHEINIIDFMVLEVIREYYPEVYNDIWTSSNNYMGIDPSSDEEKKQKDSEKYITELLTKNNRTEEVSQVLRLLGLLFPNFKFGVKSFVSYSAGGKQRVSDPDYIGKYFYMRVPHGELPDKEVDEVIGRWNNHDGKAIASDLADYRDRMKLGPLCISVGRHLHELSRALYNSLAKELCKMSLSSFPDKKETYKSMALLFASLETRASVLMECIDCAQDVEFLAIIVEHQCNQGNQVKMEEISTKYFDLMKRRYIDSQRDIFQELEIANPNPLKLWFITSNNQTEESRNILMEYVVASIATSEPNLVCCINALHQTGYSLKDQKSRFAFSGLLDTASKILPGATKDGEALIKNFINGHS